MRLGVVSQPSLLPGIQNDTEYGYFEVFRNKTALELSGFFDTNIWHRLVLQICHEEAFARHVVIAIGALTKTTAVAASCKNGPGFLDVSARQHYDYALQQYGKALRLMQDIRHQETKTRLRNTLTSTLLTTCFESYIGNQENAFAQAQAGVDVLAEYRDRPLLGKNGGYLDHDRGYSLSLFFLFQLASGDCETLITPQTS